MHPALDQLNAIVRRERGRLAAVARAEGANAEDAVDCVQEALCTFLNLDKKGELPESIDEWPQYLSTIVANAAKNRRRRHFRAKPHLEMIEELEVDSSEATAEEMLANAEDHVRLHACVRELCTVQRAVVTLRMLEEKPGDDVALALGISREHVAVLLHRAKKSLHVCMMIHA